MKDSLIRWQHLKKLIPMSRTTVWRWEKSGKFPRSVKINSRVIGWNRDEITQWLKDKENMKKPDSCLNCGEKTRFTRIGFIQSDGYLCDSCKMFHDKNGKIRQVIEIVRQYDKYLTYSNLVFQPKTRAKKARKKTT